ncbi:hypothetical protein EJ110_NYTH41530 [Nymphaea thermarum]|nr:hypothetical protein EJ110_NYTH41530 [Nymphaea thermarum]
MLREELPYLKSRHPSDSFATTEPAATSFSTIWLPVQPFCFFVKMIVAANGALCLSRSVLERGRGCWDETREQVRLLDVPEDFTKSCFEESLEGQDYFLPPFPPPLIPLNATYFRQLKMIADVAIAKRLQNLGLSFCGRLVDIPGIEELKWLKCLNLGGCRSLHHLLKERLQVNSICKESWILIGMDI